MVAYRKHNHCCRSQSLKESVICKKRNSREKGDRKWERGRRSLLHSEFMTRSQRKQEFMERAHRIRAVTGDCGGKWHISCSRLVMVSSLVLTVFTPSRNNGRTSNLLVCRHDGGTADTHTLPCPAGALPCPPRFNDRASWPASYADRDVLLVDVIWIFGCH